MLVKRYGNRRLYDTEDSRYVTLQELADKIRAGSDARVLDAKTGQDLTQPTLAQIIMENRGAARLLPISLLLQLIRLGDEPLAEFLGRTMSVALEMYLQARRGAQSATPYYPFATMPFDASGAFARMMLGSAPWVEPQPPAQPGVVRSSNAAEVADLRRELEELKKSLKRKQK
jgi:polyhydroxyalkanoate synthesis repressor PhaR